MIVLANPNIGGSQNLTMSGPIDLAGFTLTHTISNTALTTYAGPVFGGGIIKAGAGTLLLSGTNSFTGFVTVNSGAMRIASSSALGSSQNRTTIASGAALELQTGALSSEPVNITGSGIASGGAIRNLSGSNSLGPVTLLGDASIAVDSGSLTTGPISGAFVLTKGGPGTLSADSYRVGAFVISAGLARVTPGRSTLSTSVVNKASIAAGATLDLGDNDLVIDYSTTDPLTTIQSYLANGYSGGAWTGTGINSSVAAANAAATHRTALGFAEASDVYSTFPATFSGQSVDATSILIRYCASGDANIDGTVDTIDFNLLAANFSQSAKRWFNGDFNFDTTVDTIDFNLLASNFSFALATVDDRQISSLVPEPGIYAIPIIGLAFVSQRARLRRSPRTAIHGHG